MRAVLTRHPLAVNAAKLTLSGNEITDAVRAAGVQGDGLAVGSGMGIWPAATNLIVNGNATTNTTGWSQWGSASVFTRVTSQAKFGTTSIRVLRDATAGQLGIHTGTAIGVSAATAYTASTWLYWPTRLTGSVVIAIVEVTGGSASTTTTRSTATSGWERLTVTHTTGAGVSEVRVRIYHTDTSDGEVYYVGGIQLESGSVATPYIETDGGTAARSASRVQVPVRGLFTSTRGWWALRMAPGWGSNEPNTAPRMASWLDAGDDGIRFLWAADTSWNVESNATGGGAAQNENVSYTWTLDTAGTHIGAWTATELIGSSDGAAFTAATARTEIPTISATTMDIGTDTITAAREFNGRCLWFACGSNTLTSADAARIHAFGNRVPNPESFPDTAQLTGLWDGKSSYMQVFV